MLTFSLAVLEGGGAFVFGEQTPSTGEAAGAPGLRLVRAHGAGLAGLEAIGREEAWRTLAWKSEVMAQAGRRAPQGRGCGWSQALLLALARPWKRYWAPEAWGGDRVQVAGAIEANVRTTWVMGAGSGHLKRVEPQEPV